MGYKGSRIPLKEKLGISVYWVRPAHRDDERVVRLDRGDVSHEPREETGERVPSLWPGEGGSEIGSAAAGGWGDACVCAGEFVIVVSASAS